MCVHAQLLSRVRLFATRWIITWQAPLSMEFSRREDWSGLAFPPSGDLPDPEIGPASLASPALAGGFFCATGKAPNFIVVDKIYKVLQRKFRSSDLLNCKLFDVTPCHVNYIPTMYSTVCLWLMD